MKSNAIIALGSNVPLENSTPYEMVLHGMRVVSESIGEVSSGYEVYRSPSFPAGSGPDYANTVIRVCTDLQPNELLERLHQIESDLGRTRSKRWESRVIDLDLLAVEQQFFPDEATVKRWITLPLSEQMQQAPERLILPHPRIQDRAFVLVPMADVAPDWVHPVLNKTTREMLDHLDPALVAEIVLYK